MRLKPDKNSLIILKERQKLIISVLYYRNIIKII